MNSPVLHICSSIISINRQEDTPIFIQISNQIAQAIRQGILLENTRLPGSRTLASHLKINRNTVVSAYEELSLQGWIKISASKGAFVLKNDSFEKQDLEKSPKVSSQLGFSFFAPTILGSPYEKIQTKYHFNEGIIDNRLQPLAELSLQYRNALKKRTIIDGTFSIDNFEKSSFIHQLINYVNTTRGMKIDKEQIVSASTREVLLYTVAQLLIKPGDVVLVADLGNFYANMIFQKTGAKVIQVPADKEGIDVDFIKKHFLKNKIRCVYCTPRRHFPTTVIMGASRKKELIDLAIKYQFAIIEDDFDMELQWQEPFVLPMASFQNNGTVIYLSTFGSHLLSTFQKGLMIAPKPFAIAVKNYLNMIEPHRDTIMDYALAQMIQEGEIHRYHKKSIVIYNQRMDHFCSQLHKQIGKYILFEKPLGGFAVYITFKKNISLMQLKEKCALLGLTLPIYILYQTKNHCGIRLGFAHLNEEEQITCIQILKKAIEQILKKE